MRTLPGLALWMFVALALSPQGAEGSDPGFKPIFDGVSLNDWTTPDPSYWTVEEGAITGRITPERPCRVNQYLVWKGGELADFELKLEARLNGEGGINNGFQFRSRLLPDHDVCGYQMDNNLQTPWLVRLYDEYGRHTLAWRGERAVFHPSGGRAVEKIKEAEGVSWFRLEEWHEYHLACVGSRIMLRVNGRVAAEVEDRDTKRFEAQGILALQLHSGPPTVAQFRNIRLKVLRPAEQPEMPKPTRADEIRAALRRDAVAWWPLDGGGHGARPELRHFPEWDKFELNVRATGAGARKNAKAALLQGAYFKASPELPVHGRELTVYLRVRDPEGRWDSALVGKGDSAENGSFSLFAADLPETSGADICFVVQTESGSTRASFPVARIEPTAWHGLVGRFDGQSVELFCNGERMAREICRGALVRNSEPLLIGAEAARGKITRQFHGELEVAALWARALTEGELRELSTP